MCGVNTSITGVPEDMEDTCLYKITAEDMVNEVNKAFSVMAKPLEEQEEFEKTPAFASYMLFPTIDDFADNPFLPSSPITILHKGEQKMVPWMTGLTPDEGAMLVTRFWKDMDPENNKVTDAWGYIGAKSLLNKNAKEITFEDKLKAKMIAHFYVGKDGINRENKQGLMDIFTDAYFAAPNTEAVNLHAKSRAPVYNYLFSYKGTNSLGPFYAMGDPSASKEDFGIVHGDDVFYMFKYILNGKQMIESEDDKKAVELYQRLLVNFARYGNPTPVPYDDIPNWPPAQKSKYACVYYNISLKPTEEHRMFSERMTFWNLIEFKDLLEKYAIDEEEEELLNEIETTITEVEEEELEDDDVDLHHGHHKNKKGRKHAKKFKKQRQGRWKKLKQRHLAKRKRMAKRLRSLQC